MTVLYQVLIGLLATFIAYMAGLARRTSFRQLTYWRARRFWRPFISGKLKIVSARFRDFNDWEASGLVGVGGMQAAAELTAFFDDVGYRRLGASLEIVYHDRIVGDLSGTSLVCIGGPDANEVTRRMLRKVDHTIEQGDPDNPKRHIISFRDTMTGKVYVPSYELSGEGLRFVTADYGMLIKAPNPFNSRHGLIIIAGCFGYGVWAGVKLARSPEFLRLPLIAQGVAVECFYRTDVIDEVPQIPEVILIRRI